MSSVENSLFKTRAHELMKYFETKWKKEQRLTIVCKEVHEYKIDKYYYPLSLEIFQEPLFGYDLFFLR